MRVNKDLLVRVQYKLYEVDESGNELLIEETSADNPLVYIQGLGIMLSGFEAGLAGKSAGDSFDFILQPEDGYGDYREDLYITIPKSAFFVDGQFDERIVYEGALVPMMSDDGQTVTGQVIKISKDEVEMDFNHQLAGAVLRFKGEIEEVREATNEEFQAALAPITSGGCGCGCGKACGCSSDGSDGCGSGGGCGCGCGC